MYIYICIYVCTYINIYTYMYIYPYLFMIMYIFIYDSVRITFEFAGLWADETFDRTMPSATRVSFP